MCVCRFQDNHWRRVDWSFFYHWNKLEDLGSSCELKTVSRLFQAWQLFFMRDNVNSVVYMLFFLRMSHFDAMPRPEKLGLQGYDSISYQMTMMNQCAFFPNVPEWLLRGVRTWKYMWYKNYEDHLTTESCFLFYRLCNR
ncbi:hypothetical protein O9G_002909 [Rozella allomycis CSF55]|uniref:Uncharacterized protein n=1 Tax=Rozella allomycis (strain CSF55) TaxID=988480 RepID=A0A075B4J6_ROZAC|nr:hypothetical protein O9G_002909 [Rozella allomycis CSF55]|eukprot:EPZ36407.1 hypothetical protein O9G_002909 [Rozella allomycis CSF55]